MPEGAAASMAASGWEGWEGWQGTGRTLKGSALGCQGLTVFTAQCTLGRTLWYSITDRPPGQAVSCGQVSTASQAHQPKLSLDRKEGGEGDRPSIPANQSASVLPLMPLASLACPPLLPLPLALQPKANITAAARLPLLLREKASCLCARPSQRPPDSNAVICAISSPRHPLSPSSTSPILPLPFLLLLSPPLLLPHLDTSRVRHQRRVPTRPSKQTPLDGQQPATLTLASGCCLDSDTDRPERVVTTSRPAC